MLSRGRGCSEPLLRTSHRPGPCSFFQTFLHQKNNQNDNARAACSTRACGPLLKTVAPLCKNERARPHGRHSAARGHCQVSAASVAAPRAPCCKASPRARKWPARCVAPELATLPPAPPPTALPRPPPLLRITIVPDEKVPNAALFVVSREDHTVGNLMRMCVSRRAAERAARAAPAAAAPPPIHPHPRTRTHAQGAAA